MAVDNDGNDEDPRNEQNTAGHWNSSLVGQLAFAPAIGRRVGGICSVDPSAPHHLAWTDLELRVESEVSLLRSLLGVGCIWSPALHERLRARCISHGCWTLLSGQSRLAENRRGGDGPVIGEALTVLTGGFPIDEGSDSAAVTVAPHSAHAWVQRHSNPQEALQELLSHPAFGIDVASANHGAYDSRARVAVAVVGVTEKSRRGTGRPSKGRKCRPPLVVLVLTWRGKTAPPLGQGLLALAESRRQASASYNSALVGSLERIRHVADKVGAVGRDEETLSRLPRLIAALVKEAQALQVDASPSLENCSREPPAHVSSSVVQGHQGLRHADESGEIGGGGCCLLQERASVITREEEVCIQ
eukprot:TRINITY_DN60779_c0_g1_i1.p1 TRINITY_DN60779_c0_g1~~TRINITY_DN60779_c0_g1_i1.p1  ORF type:complete len:359 (+),score=45.66 TRINITY_DN60779_c0_g1_i1:97-1173(+)